MAEKKKPANNQKFTVSLNDEDIPKLHIKPRYTLCRHLRKKNSKRNQINIYLGYEQPDIGVTCSCGITHDAKDWPKHYKTCMIQKAIETGILQSSDTGTSASKVDRLKTVKEYQDLENQPVFGKNASGQLTMRFHHSYYYACPSCGSRSKSINSLYETHHNELVGKDPCKKPKCKKPISWKDTQPPQPPLPPVNYVTNKVTPDFIESNDEAEYVAVAAAAKTTSVTTASSETASVTTAAVSSVAAAAKTTSVNIASDSSAAVVAAADDDDDTTAAVADVVVVDTTNSTTATSVVVAVADNNNENNTDNNGDDDMKVDNEENENNTEERVATAAAVVVAATSTDRHSTRSSVTAVTDTTTTAAAAAAAVAITSTSNRNKKRPVTGTIAAVVQTTKGRKMAASIPLFQKVAAKTSTVKGVVRKKGKGVERKKRKCNIQKEVQVPITPTRKSPRKKSHQST